jgi:hypothetical protein
VHGSTPLAFAAALAAATFAGCTGDGDPVPDPDLPDGAPLVIEPTAAMSVGVLEGDPMQELDRVADAFLTPGGHLAVATGESVRIFGADGAFVESLGGRGEGPGEFMTLRAAWARGDTIEVWDSSSRRITRFLPGGEVQVTTLRVVEQPLDAGIGPLGDGWALVSIDLGDVRDRMAAELVSREGTHETRLVELPGMARYQTEHASGPHPVTPTALFQVHDGELYAGETLEPVIRVFDATGMQVREIPLPLDAPGPASAVFEQVIDSAVARADDSAAAAAIEQSWTSYAAPERLSTFWAFLIDERGFVWVRPYEPFRHALALGGVPSGRAGPSGAWLVLAPDGTEVGRVAAPPGLEIVQVGSEAVVGIHRSELGVESVRVHPLRRNPAGAD